MRHFIPFSLLTVISLVGCIGNSTLPPTVAAQSPSVIPTAVETSASEPAFAGEAAQLIDEDSGEPVEVRAEPSDQATVIASLPGDEVVRAIDSTRDQNQQMWYEIRRASGSTGWVRGQFIRFIADSDPTARPVVVMPGEVPILAEPNNNASQVGSVQGGEILTVLQSVKTPELDNRQSTWLQIDRGWVSAEFLFQPACLRFNGNPLMVVGVAGATVRSTPTPQAQQVDRLEGGETVIPLRIETNSTGEWLQTEQGWVDQQQLFLPTCQALSE